jgi:hypothetical protein
MPEKIRVSPAAAPQLSTGVRGQAALVPEDELLEPEEEEPEEEEPEDDEPEDPEEPLDDDPEEADPDEDVPDDDSAFAGTALLPFDRLSFR